jgi:hypothetical protein
MTDSTHAGGRKSWGVTLHLHPEDQFTANNLKGFPFSVRTIRYTGGSTFMLNGTAIKTDGQSGLVDRYRECDFTMFQKWAGDKTALFLLYILRETGALI